jgi:4-amino-4-deoxy-L-arabinose transferase-like glycosyltransferase
MRNEAEIRTARRCFIVLWVVACLAKLALAARLPLFVDEAFYWQEGRHLAAAYSDLPGLTAWLARLGSELGPGNALAVRAPFLVLAALVPWLVVRIARREFAPAHAWQAGTLALLLPLAGTLGLLALPDVPMAFATLLCIDAGARLLRGIAPGPVLELAVGLAIGAFSHYRFVAVIGVGLLAWLALPEGRRLLRDWRVWPAILAGALAWWPVFAWNLQHAEAGVRFQLVDRHPWAFHFEGAWFVLVQALLATPLLFAAMLRVAWPTSLVPSGRHYLALLGGLVLLGFFVLGFFADVERVSFHWPLPGYLALLPLVPALLARWPRGWRVATWTLAAAGLVVGLAAFAAVSHPGARASAAAAKWYPANFAGWDALAAAVREQQAGMPPGTRLVAGDFKLGAELGFLLGEADIPVLDHPLNHRHGRAPQLRLWGLERTAVARDAPTLLVVSATAVDFRRLHAYYRALCAAAGPLPPPRVVNIDHGRQRFLLFALGAARAGRCTTPGLAWIDAPEAGAEVAGDLEVRGWAFKDGVGLDAVEVTLDGRVVATARYGDAYPGLQTVWRGSDDPNHPRVGFSARVPRVALPPGAHWLGLRLRGSDGSVEDWPEVPVRVAD